MTWSRNWFQCTGTVAYICTELKDDEMDAMNGRKRVSIFVDGANMFYTQKKGLGWFFDPAKLLKVLKGNDELTDAYWFMGIKQPPDARDENFIRFLAYAGYVVRTKALKTFYDTDSGDSTQKANLDIEIVMDMFNTVENYDKAILLSGDGDFERALELLRSRGKEICVVSTQNWIAAELRMAVGSHFLDLQDLRDKIERIDNEHRSDHPQTFSS
jgi:uncharacterized LabA/DUF88 family protein